MGQLLLLYVEGGVEEKHIDGMSLEYLFPNVWRQKIIVIFKFVDLLYHKVCPTFILFSKILENFEYTSNEARTE